MLLLCVGSWGAALKLLPLTSWESCGAVTGLEDSLVGVIGVVVQLMCSESALRIAVPACSRTFPQKRALLGF